MESLEEFDKQSLRVNKERKTINFNWKHGPVFIDHKNSRINVQSGKEKSVNIIKRNYTLKVLNDVGKKYGWIVKNKSKKAQEKNKFILIKR